MLNYINSIQIDLKYILSSYDYFVLFLKYNKNTPNWGKNSFKSFKYILLLFKQFQNTVGLVRVN